MKVGPLEMRVNEYYNNIAHKTLINSIKVAQDYDIIASEEYDESIPVLIKDGEWIIFAMNKSKTCYNINEIRDDNDDEWTAVLNIMIIDKYPSIEDISNFITYIFKGATDEEKEQYSKVISFMNTFKKLLYEGEYRFSNNSNIFKKDKSVDLSRTIIIQDVCKLDKLPINHDLERILPDDKSDDMIMCGYLLESFVTVQ